MENNIIISIEERKWRRIKALVVGGRLTAHRWDCRFPAIRNICDRYSIVSHADDIETEGSIQAELVRVIADQQKGIESDYLKAQQSSRGMLFDQVTRAEVGGLVRGGGGFAEATVVTALIGDPQFLMFDQGVLEYFVIRLKNDGSAFLKMLSEEFHNAERRFDRKKVDMMSLCLAKYWTDPHLPMWLMNRETLLQVCQSILPDENWTENTIKNRLGHKKLEGYAKRPIIGVRMSASHQVADFKIRPGIFKAMKNTEFESLNHMVVSAHPTEDENSRIAQEMKNCESDEIVQLLAEISKRFPYKEKSIVYRAVNKLK